MGGWLHALLAQENVAFDASFLTTINAEIKVSSVQLKALPGTQIQLAPAPGVNKAIVPQKCVLRYVAGVTPYTIGNADNALSSHYGGVGNFSQINFPTPGMLDQATNQFASFSWDQLTTVPETVVSNQPFTLQLTGTTPALTLGDGTLEIFFQYVIVDFNQ